MRILKLNRKIQKEVPTFSEFAVFKLKGSMWHDRSAVKVTC